jgi:hypothetical protein
MYVSLRTFLFLVCVDCVVSIVVMVVCVCALILLLLICTASVYLKIVYDMRRRLVYGIV